jgi:hypothetical protein
VGDTVYCLTEKLINQKIKSFTKKKIENYLKTKHKEKKVSKNKKLVMDYFWKSENKIENRP